MKKLPRVLEKPSLPDHLPNTSRWLAGEGAGSWFVFESTSGHRGYIITRYAPSGQQECRGHFRSDAPIDLLLEFDVDYPSHCQTVTVVQRGRKIRCERLPQP